MHNTPTRIMYAHDQIKELFKNKLSSDINEAKALIQVCTITTITQARKN